MVEPWFDPNAFAWIPGTALGVVAGTWGSAVGYLAPRGKAKSLVLGLGWALVAVCVLLLAAGIVALVLKQPYGVWYGLLLPGVVGPVALGINLPIVYRRYHEAEKRRMEAQDISL